MIVSKVYKGDVEFTQGYKGTQLIFSSGRLPSQYQEVEYLQSTSTQHYTNYIDTGVTMTTDTILKMDFEFDSTYPFTDWSRLYGTAMFEMLGYDSLTNPHFRFGDYSNEWEYSDGFQYATKYHLEVGGGNVILNGNTIHTYTPIAIDSYSLQIFTSHQDRDGCFKLYGCQIEENGVLLRDFVPCYIKDSIQTPLWAIGLYDTVGEQFYHNLGTVPFLVGGNV